MLSKGLSEIRLKAAMGKLKVVSEDGIGSLLPLAPTLHKLVSLNFELVTSWWELVDAWL